MTISSPESDFSRPFAYLWETLPGKQLVRPFKVHAVVEDSKGQTAISNPVTATLGQDEQPPVLNISSPAINITEGGAEIATVIEETTAIVKFVGYDNIGVTRARLTGIATRTGSYAELTGNPEDILEDDDLVIQQVPGALNAYSIMKMVSVPSFSGEEGVIFDRYPLSMEVWDEVGNSARLDITIGVTRDEVPVVIDVNTNKNRYNILSTLELDVAAADDRAVTQISVQIEDPAGTELAAITHNSPEDFIQAQHLTHRLDFALSEFDLPNEDQTLAILVQAMDVKGLESELFVTEAVIEGDVEAPIASVMAPIQGTQVVPSQIMNMQWRAVDKSGVRSVELMLGGTVVDSL